MCVHICKDKQSQWLERKRGREGDFVHAICVYENVVELLETVKENTKTQLTISDFSTRNNKTQFQYAQHMIKEREREGERETEERYS